MAATTKVARMTCPTWGLCGMRSWRQVGQQLPNHFTPKPSLGATRHMATKPPRESHQAEAASTSARGGTRATRATEAHITEPLIMPSPGQHREALRSAEAREAALRAARMRRLDEREKRSREAVEDKLKRESLADRYKTASRKWISTIVALPILLVTSYYLFDRLALGRAPKTLPRSPAANHSQT